MRQFQRAFVVSIFVLTACHRSLPEWVTPQQLDALVSIADEAAATCDSLIFTERDCFTGMEIDRGEENGRPAVPTPATLLGGSPQLRAFEATCTLYNTPEHGPYNKWCAGNGIVRGLAPILDQDACPPVAFQGKTLEKDATGEAIYVLGGAHCPPKARIIVKRRTPRGVTVEVTANIFSAEYAKAQGWLAPAERMRR